MIDVSKLEVVRTTNIVAGERYTVRIHGNEPVVMTCVRKPSRPLSQMTPRDAFVFQAEDGTKVRFKTHGTKGPQFLVTKVTGVRGLKTNARVTFYNLPVAPAKRQRKAKVAPVAEQAAA